MADLSTKEIEKIKETVTKKVGENIRKLREKRKLTQTELAAKIQSDRQYLYKIEKGKVGLSVGKLAVIAKALEVHPKVLVDF